MRTKIQLLFLLSTFFTIGLVGVACATPRIDLIKNDTVKINRVPSTGYRFTKIFAYNEDDKLVVTGRLKRQHSGYFGSGHVDISILSPDGEKWNQVSTYYIPRHVRRNPSRGSRFEVRLPNIPPVGSTIRVAHHVGVKTRNWSFQCETNRAIPND